MSDKTSQTEAAIPQVNNRKKKNLWLWLILVGALIGGVFAFSYHHIAREKSSMEYELAERQRIIASTRAERAEMWLQGLVERAKRLVNSDIFQLFASEVDKYPGGIPVFFGEVEKLSEELDGEDTGDSLASRVPFMRTLLMDFTSDNGFSSACIVSSKGEPYMTTAATMEPLEAEQLGYINQVISSGEIVYAPLDATNSGISLTVYIPILPPQHLRESGKPVAVIMVSSLAGQNLAAILSPGLFGSDTQDLLLVQKGQNAFQEVDLKSSGLRLVRDFFLSPENDFSFSKRNALVNKHSAYSSGVKVRALDWWIVVENATAEIEKTLASKTRNVYMLSGLFSLVLLLLVVALWWRFVGREQSAINEQFRVLLSVIKDQKQLLDGINNTISDPITLMDVTGSFGYVNKAFAKAIGKTEEEIIGLDGTAVFGFDTAKRLSVPDQHVLMTGESVSVSEVMWLQSKRYYFQISKTPLLDNESKTPQGIVSVYRDITQLVEAEQHSRRVVQQTISALVQAIEQVDPFLGGHSRIMGGIATLIAKQLGLGPSDIATIETAANLSQIGKMFVPRDILLKPGRLTDAEKKEMEKHVEYTYDILKGVEFDLPVLAVLKQMNEALDGSGYPEKLSGDQISMHARVVAVANAFAAMARPRSYRGAMGVEKVLEILQSEVTRNYDESVVDALREVLATPAGEKIVEQAAQSQAM